MENTATPEIVEARGRAIPPQRSYRTLPRSRAGSWTALITALICVVVVAFAASPLVQLLTWLDFHILEATGVPVTFGYDHYLWINLTPILFTMPLHPWLQLVTCIVCCIIAVFLLSTVLRRIEVPLRYWITFNILIVGAEAAYLLFAGHLGYSSAAYSTLILRTSVTSWLMVPPIIGLIAMLFPFRATASISLVVICTVYEIILSFARYAAFIAILTHTGPLLMAVSYLLYGPLLDILPIIGIYSLFLQQLAREIGHKPEAWKWL